MVKGGDSENSFVAEKSSARNVETTLGIPMEMILLLLGWITRQFDSEIEADQSSG
jgi:hypothetical protein